MFVLSQAYQEDLMSLLIAITCSLNAHTLAVVHLPISVFPYNSLVKIVKSCFYLHLFSLSSFFFNPRVSSSSGCTPVPKSHFFWMFVLYNKQGNLF